MEFFIYINNSLLLYYLFVRFFLYILELLSVEFFCQLIWWVGGRFFDCWVLQNRIDFFRIKLQLCVVLDGIVVVLLVVVFVVVEVGEFEVVVVFGVVVVVVVVVDVVVVDDVDEVDCVDLGEILFI